MIISSSSASSDQSLVGPNRNSANDSGEFNSDQMKEYDMCQDYVDDKWQTKSERSTAAASQIPKIPQHIQMHKQKPTGQKSFLVTSKQKQMVAN